MSGGGNRNAPQYDKLCMYDVDGTYTCSRMPRDHVSSVYDPQKDSGLLYNVPFLKEHWTPSPNKARQHRASSIFTGYLIDVPTGNVRNETFSTRSSQHLFKNWNH